MKTIIKFKKKLLKHPYTTYFKKFIVENKKTVLALLLAAIFGDIIFVTQTSSDYLLFGILCVYALFSKICGTTSKTTFILCLVLLSGMSLSYIGTYTSVATEKSAVWFVLLFIVGIIQKWRE